MALLRGFERKQMEPYSLHKEIEASYTVFKLENRTFIQINTSGTKKRAIPGKTSQTIQLDREGALALYQILKTEFRLD